LLFGHFSNKTINNQNKIRSRSGGDFSLPLLTNSSRYIAMMKHEELPWLTLVSCKGYDEMTDSYRYRVLVRAVLIEVK